MHNLLVDILGNQVRRQAARVPDDLIQPCWRIQKIVARLESLNGSGWRCDACPVSPFLTGCICEGRQTRDEVDLLGVEYYLALPIYDIQRPDRCALFGRNAA